MGEESKPSRLAIEDAIHEHSRPKIESYGAYWFLIVLGTSIHDDQIVFHEMAVFVGTNFIVTVRHRPPSGQKRSKPRPPT